MADVQIKYNLHLESLIHDENLFIERSFLRKPLDDFLSQFRNMSDTVFLTGILENELIKLGFQRALIENCKKDYCEQKKNKRIIIPTPIEDAKDIFRIFCEEKEREKTLHWIHYVENDFFHWKTEGNPKEPFKYRDDVIHEEQLLEFTDNEKVRVVLIADEPGSGKSTVLAQMVKKVNENRPSSWAYRIAVTDLFSHSDKINALENLIEATNNEEFLELFLNTIHRKELSKKEEIKLQFQQPMGASLFLDGFDELPKYHRSTVISLLKRLKKETKAQIWVTSRVSLSTDLVIELETISYSLKPWEENDQQMYLCKLWHNFLMNGDMSKAKDKVYRIIKTLENQMNVNVSVISRFILQMKQLYESDEMQKHTCFMKDRINVNFSEVAKILLEKSRELMFSSEFEFLGKPLHVYLLGTLIYDNNFEDFSYSNSFNLLSIFLDSKIQIFLEEKCGFNGEHDLMKKTVSNYRADIQSIHKRIAYQSVGIGKVDFASLREDYLFPFLNEIGLVKVTQNDMIFFHKTFEEFLFAAYVLDDIVRETPSEDFLRKLLLDPEYNAASKFLNGGLENMKTIPRVAKGFFKKFNVTEIFESFITKEENFSDFIKLWEYIIRNLEIESIDKNIQKFITESKRVFQNWYISSNNAFLGFKILMRFLGKKWIMQVLNFRDNFFQDVVLMSFSKCSREDLDFIIRNIEEYIIGTSNRNITEKTICNDPYKPEVEHSIEISEESLVKELLEKKDKHGRNLLMYACMNKDIKVFQRTVKFLQNMFGENYKELLVAEDTYGSSILYYMTENGPLYFKTIWDLVQSQLEKDEIRKIVLSQDRYSGTPDLWHVVECLQDGALCKFLENVKKLITSESFKKILFMQDKCKKTILHYALESNISTSYNILLNEVANFITNTSDEDKLPFLNWINSRDEWGKNIATNAAIKLDYKNLTKFFETLRKILNDDKSFYSLIFEGIVLCKKFAIEFTNKYIDTSSKVLDYLRQLMQDDASFHKLLKTGDSENGVNFIFMAVWILDLNRICTFFEYLRTFIDTKTMRELFLEIDSDGNTILHSVCCNGHYGAFTAILDEAHKLCSKEELQKMIMKSDDCGHTLFHFIPVGISLIDELENVSYFIGEENMKELLLTEDEEGETCLHKVYNYSRIDPLILTLNIQFVSKFLQDDDLKRFLLKKDNTDHTFYYYVRQKCEESDLFQLLKLLKEILSKESFLELTSVM